MIRKFKRISLLVLAVALILSMGATVMVVSALSESESNNTWQTADTTTNDTDTFGVLSSADDIDWWKVTFSQSGYANFWLDSSAGYNYDLRVYDDSITLLERSINGGRQELVRYNIEAGETYYMRVYVKSGTAHGGQYTLRAKRYAAESIKLFTVNDGSFNSTATSPAIMQYYWDAGYDGSNYLNNSAASVYTALTNSNVFIAHVRWGPGHLELPSSVGTTGLYAERGQINEDTDRYLEDMVPGTLNNLKMAVFCGDYTGMDNGFTGNLVDMTLAKGADCAFGWMQDINDTHATNWLGYFSLYIGVGDKIETAMDKADEDLLKGLNTDNSTTTNRYYGTSNINQVIG